MAQSKTIIRSFFFIFCAFSYIAGTAMLGYGAYGVGKFGAGNFKGNQYVLLIFWGACMAMNEILGGVAALIKSRFMLIIHGVLQGAGAVISIGAAGVYLHFSTKVPMEEAKFFYIGAGLVLVIVTVRILEATLACIQGCGIKKDELKQELLTSTEA